jgi:hypothetical protein
MTSPPRPKVADLQTVVAGLVSSERTSKSKAARKFAGGGGIAHCQGDGGNTEIRFCGFDPIGHLLPPWVRYGPDSGTSNGPRA